MKTTIEIADDLLERARRQAIRENRTLREIIEEALRKHFASKKDSEPFRLTRHAFKGKGLHPSIAEGDWTTVRDLIYRK